MANIQDVAKQAGVSISTVSRVLNGTAKVKSEVKKKVEASIEALTYQPNPAARSLRTNRSKIIGLIIPDLQTPFFMRIVQQVEEEIQTQDYLLVLCNSKNNTHREQNSLNKLIVQRVGGIILVPIYEDTIEIESKIQKCHERNIKMVVCSNFFSEQEHIIEVEQTRKLKEAVSELMGLEQVLK